jgi:hypothetical protein
MPSMSAGLSPFACAIRTIASSWRSVIRPLAPAAPSPTLDASSHRGAGRGPASFTGGSPWPFDRGRGGGAELAGHEGGVPGGPEGLAGAPARKAAPWPASGLSA